VVFYINNYILAHAWSADIHPLCSDLCYGFDWFDLALAQDLADDAADADVSASFSQMMLNLVPSLACELSFLLASVDTESDDLLWIFFYYGILLTELTSHSITKKKFNLEGKHKSKFRNGLHGVLAREHVRNMGFA